VVQLVGVDLGVFRRGSGSPWRPEQTGVRPRAPGTTQLVLGSDLQSTLVGRRGKFCEKLMAGQSDATIDFDQLCELLRWLGFDEHVHGDHHVFSMIGMIERINLQPKGRHAKGYQVRQVRDMLRSQGMHVE